MTTSPAPQPDPDQRKFAAPRSPVLRRVLSAALAIGAVLVLAAPASAVLPGRNGLIAFTSGREAANDNEAKLFTINPVKRGPLGEPFSIPTTQNRHASWSPDRTKVVFAAGTPGTLATEEFDLWVRDFEAGTITALDPAELDDKSSDHPAWSPDGTRIAYEHQPVDGSTERNIMVKAVGRSSPAVPLTTGAPFELKPAWSPDSQEIYYASSPTPPPTTQFDIVKKPAGAGPGTAPTGVATSATVDEYQPSISPDGSRICYTRQSTLGSSATADIYVASLPGLASPQDLSDDTATGDINCTWSPDGLKIAFTNGTFSQGRLMIENADESDGIPPLFPLTDDLDSNNFDGNADWAPDGSPDCPDSTVTTPVNTPITINLECTDTGPAYERTDPNGFVANGGAPANGTTSDRQPLGNPSTVRYTPNAGFTGTDTLVFTSFDDFGFGTDRGTVTIKVGAPGGGGSGGGAGGGAGGGGGGGGATSPECAGRKVTILGTSGNDTLLGTSGPDVIAGQGGDDRIRAGRGDDIVCGGSGQDGLSGSSGQDTLGGGPGDDRLSGGSGRDKLSGNAGRDRLRGGSSRDRCAGGPGRDRSSSCERTSA